MMSTFDSTLALMLLAHPFQVALMVLTLGALIRSAKQMRAGLAYSFFTIIDFFLDRALASVAVASTVAIVVATVLTLAR